MDIMDVTAENLATEHICCAMTQRKGETCIQDKKDWLLARFADGLVFKKLDVRGKVFVEYMPAERAWNPINAPGYMHINCLWVAGQYKAQGWGARLLEACMEDARAKGHVGLTVIAAKNKRTFLSEGAFFKHHGFQVADTAKPDFELLYLPFEAGAPVPAFMLHAKANRLEDKGLVLYYSCQCPYTHMHAERVRDFAASVGRKVTLHRLSSADEAQRAPAPFATYSLYMDGQLLSNEVLTVERFRQRTGI